MLSYQEIIAEADTEEVDAEIKKQEIIKKEATYRIRFKPIRDIFTSGVNPLLLLAELKELGLCKVISRLNQIPPFLKLNPEKCYIYWDILITTDQGVDKIKDVFLFVEDECKLQIDIIDMEGVINENTNKKIGEILMINNTEIHL